MPRKTVKTTTTVVTETTEGTGAPAKTLVTFLLDRTGSMQSIKSDTIGGFNAYLDSLQREAGDLVEFTFLQFDSISVDKLYLGSSLRSVKRLTEETYQPRANTPLIDACVKAIKATEDLAATRAAEHPRIVVVFQTDGEENCSREYTSAQLIDLIKDKTRAGWEFVYMGANIDAYKTAHSLGIARQNTMSYTGDLSREAFTASAQNTGLYSRGLVGSTSFSMGQKTAAGDRFDVELKAKIARGQKPKRPVVDDIKIT